MLKLLVHADKKVVSMARRMGFAIAAAQSAKRGPRAPRAARADTKEAAAAAAPSRPRKRGQRERKLRAAAARKLQVLARCFLAQQRRLRATAADISVAPAALASSVSTSEERPAAGPEPDCAMAAASSDSPAPERERRSYVEAATFGKGSSASSGFKRKASPCGAATSRPRSVVPIPGPSRGASLADLGSLCRG